MKPIRYSKQWENIIKTACNKKWSKKIYERHDFISIRIKIGTLHNFEDM